MTPDAALIGPLEAGQRSIKRTPHSASVTLVATGAADSLLSSLSYLRLPQAVQVGDVEDPAHSSGVHATGPSLLQTQVAEDLAEAGVLQE